MKNTILKIQSYIKAILIAFFTVIYSFLALIAITFKNSKLYFILASSWSSVLLKSSGIKVIIKGNEKLEKGKSYIFISNHSSHFDIPVLLSSLKGTTALVYKQELTKIPIFGYALGKSPHISIDRSHPKKAISSINSAVEKLTSGISVIIFPEGTRSKDGNMGEFKRGAFMIASRSGIPIVPITINGTYPLLPKDGFNILSGKVELIIHDVIENYQITSPSDEKKMMEDIYKIIKNAKN